MDAIQQHGLIVSHLLHHFVCGVYAKRDVMDLRNRLLYLEQEVNKRRRRATAFTTIAVGDVDEDVLWKNEVQDKCISCRIVGVNDLLVPERALVADLRYLWLQLAGRTTSLSDVVKMKKQRLRQGYDLERCYYSPALTIMQASVVGQQKVRVLGEDHTKSDGARGDLRFYVNDEECPSKMKAVNGSSNPLTDPDGIHSNRAAFGKLLKIIRTKLNDGNAGSRTFFCTFLNRIECIWFVKFEFEANDLKEVLVAPEIPAKGFPALAPICADLDSILELEFGTEDVMLSDLLSSEAPLGFRYMTRYIDTLCDWKGVPINDVVFKMYNLDIIDMREARIIARGGKSLILQVGEERAVIKVGPCKCIELEYANHKLVDGSVMNIRRMVDDVHGKVEGVEELGFIKLQGLGKCIHKNISWEELKKYWPAMETALSGLHRMKLLHRDVKPENMLLIDEQLVLHDFDVSCRSNDSSRLSEYVGTAKYRSPYWKAGDVFVPADDWVSLGLSFISLLKLPAGDDLLRQLLTHPKIPEDMREKLIAAIESSKARDREFLVRQ